MLSHVTRSLFLNHIAPDLYRTAQGRASGKELLKQRVDHAFMTLVCIGVPCVLSYLSYKCAMVVYNCDLSCCAQFFAGNTSKISCLLETAKAITVGFVGTHLAIGVITAGGGGTKDRNGWIERTIYHLKGFWDPSIAAQMDCDKLVADFKRISAGLPIIGLYVAAFSFAAFWVLPSILR